MKTERQQDQDVAERLRRENLDRVEAGGCAPPVIVTNPESAAVEAVAWDYCPEIRIAVTNGKGGANMTLNGHGAPAGISLYHGDYVSELQSALDALRGEVEDLKAQLAREEHSHGQTIDERDLAEEMLGDMFMAVTGREAEWSSAWGYPDAIEEVEDHVAVTQRKADAAERRVGELEANDRRYRFLRRKLCVTGNGDGTCAMHAINLPHRIHGWPEHGEHEQFFDAAIDSYLTGADPT